MSAQANHTFASELAAEGTASIITGIERMYRCRSPIDEWMTSDPGQCPQLLLLLMMMMISYIMSVVKGSQVPPA